MTEATLWRALNDALHEAMANDARVFVMGEELTRWATGGGNYGVTRGLASAFGQERVRDTPISEAAFVAAAVGSAMCGMRPVVEFISADFAFLAFDAIVNQAAKIRYMFGGQFSVPLVIRCPQGISRGVRAAQHSQSLDTTFAHIAGLEVVVPSTPSDARGLLLSSIGSPNPTIFLEHKALYNVRGPMHRDPVPLGRARLAREGRTLTVIATQLMVHRALAAADVLSSEGIEAEVIDLRTLFPLDLETVYGSVRKTRRAVVFHEATQLYGFGAEIAASISEACWHELAAPVLRLGGARAPIPYSPALEDEVVPTTDDVTVVMRRAARWS